MVKKYRTESGDKGVNNNSTDLESTNEKLLAKYKKRIKPDMCIVRIKSIEHLESCWPILIQTGYKK